MIPASWEISAALTGAWRLLFLDSKAVQYFDDSVEGFWKSFFAAALILPAHLILSWMHLAGLPLTAGPIRIVLVEGIGYVISWVAFPLLVFYLCEAMGRSQTYMRYIIAYNWFQVILIGIVLPIRLLLESGVLPPQIAQLLDFAKFFLTLSYFWYLALVGLGAGGWAASAIVVLDLILSLLILSVSDGMLV